MNKKSSIAFGWAAALIAGCLVCFTCIWTGCAPAVISQNGENGKGTEENLPDPENNLGSSVVGTVEDGTVRFTFSWANKSRSKEAARSVTGANPNDITGKGRGIRNVYQLIAIDETEPDKIWDFSEVRRTDTSQNFLTVSVGIVSGHTYRFLILAGHLERTPGQTGSAITYTTAPPTLLAAGYTEAVMRKGFNKINMTMYTLVVNTMIEGPGGPLEPVIGIPLNLSENSNYTIKYHIGSLSNGSEDGLLPLRQAEQRPSSPVLLAASDGWYVPAGQTEANGTALADTNKGNGANPVTTGDVALPFATGAAGSQGRLYFRLAYAPFGKTDKTAAWADYARFSVWRQSGIAAPGSIADFDLPAWTIRNGFNDEAQDSATNFANYGTHPSANSNGAIPVLAAGSTPPVLPPVSYAITNNAAQASQSTNHGYVSVQVGSASAQTGASVTAYAGDAITLAISPAANYSLGSLTITAASGSNPPVSGSGNTRTFTMPAGNVTVDATFTQNAPPPPVSYTITNNAAQASQSTNHGYVSVQVGSASAQTGASVTAYAGDTITLAISPTANYSLGSLTITAASGSNPPVSGSGNTRTFTMPAGNVTVDATFTQNAPPPPVSYAIMNNAAQASQSTNHGSVSVQVGSASAQTGASVTAYAGDTITLSISAAANYSLGTLTVTAASGNNPTVSGSGNTRTFAMPAGNVTVSATFTQNAPPPPVSYTITNNARPGALTGGSVSVQVGSASAQTGASVTAYAGDAVTLAISPAANYSLGSLTITAASGSNPPVSGSGNTRTFTMPAGNVTVDATFTQNVPPPVSPKRVSWYVSDAPNSDTPSATAEWSGDKVTDALTSIRNSSSKFSGGKKAVIVISGTVTSATEGVSGVSMFTIKGDYPPLVFRGDSATKGIIDGGNARRIFLIQPRINDSIPNDVTLAEGLTLQNGRAVSNSPSDTVGGAVNVLGGIFRMTGGVIKDSVATSGGAIAAPTWGAGNVKNNEVYLSGGEITGNRNARISGSSTTTDGAALYLQGSISEPGVYRISGSTVIRDNGTIADTEQGGAIKLDGSALNMSGGTIRDNAAATGGGVYMGPKSVFNMSSGTITGNSAANPGGGIRVSRGQYTGSTYTNTGGTVIGNTPDNVNP
ncbi:MAG: hypothetical protein LBS97_07715 [Treponema sp.]|nr:hypothetical protein [Treponema sp.]